MYNQQPINLNEYDSFSEKIKRKISEWRKKPLDITKANDLAEKYLFVKIDRSGDTLERFLLRNTE